MTFWETFVHGSSTAIADWKERIFSATSPAHVTQTYQFRCIQQRERGIPVLRNTRSNRGEKFGVRNQSHIQPCVETFSAQEFTSEFEIRSLRTLS